MAAGVGAPREHAERVNCTAGDARVPFVLLPRLVD